MDSEIVFEIEPFQPGKDTPADIALIHLSVRNWQEKVGQNTFSNILESQADLNKIERYYIDPGGNFFVARNPQKKILGFIGLRNDGNGKGVIKRLSVRPDYQRQGIGKALVGNALDWARQNGFTKISLHTNIGEKARSIYEKFGFKVVGFVEEHEDWTMELNLKGR